jgi:hemoglobin
MTTFHEAGGLKTFRRLTRIFYARVARDPRLQRLFSKNADKQRERLALFLAETFGGPKRYSQQRGQRSLQQMHAAFPIGEQEIQAWKKHMLAAMDAVGIEGPARSAMRGFFCGGLQQIADNSRYDVSLPELKQLLTQDRSVANARGHLGSLLHDAAQAWDLARVRLLLSFGAEVNARNFEGGHTPLYYAANHVDLSRPAEGIAVADTLIRHGADVKIHSGPIRGTPLHTAARRDNVVVARVLLSAGADIEARDIKGETPLRRALNCRQPGMIGLLIAHGANPDAADKCGLTPRQVAKRRGLRRRALVVGRNQARVDIAWAVISGRMSLIDAVDRYRALESSRPDFLRLASGDNGYCTDDQRLVDLVRLYVEQALTREPKRREEVLKRLEKERREHSSGGARSTPHANGS